MLRGFVLTGFLLLAWGSAVAGPAPDERLQFKIPSMPLDAALMEFARQSGTSISFDKRAVESYRGGFAYGPSTKEEALGAILTRTPFTYESVGADTVRIVLRSLEAHNKSAETSTLDRTDLILVTATKREEYAHTVPTSISAIAIDTLEQFDVRDFNALSSRFAGVSSTNLGPSRNKIFVRGISDGAFADRTQSTVGVYLNETPLISNDTNPDLRLIDVDRVEVLRGPQGALYGSGYVGGIYRIITAKPDLDSYTGRLRAAGSVTEDGGPNSAYDAVLNIPLSPGRLGMRAIGFYERARGYIDDVGLALEDVNDSEIYGGRAIARLQLAETWTIDAEANAQKVDLADSQYVFPELGELSRDNARREPYQDDFKTISLTINGDIGSAKLTSSSAFIRREISSSSDATAALPELVGDPAAEGVFLSVGEISAFNHETRFVSDGDGRMKWLAGVFAIRRRENARSILVVDNAALPALPFTSDRHDELDEIALFGEGSYRIVDALTVTAGTRISRTKMEVEMISDGVANSGPPLLERSTSLLSVSPSVALSFQRSDNLLVYIRASKGSRIGGVNTNTPLAAITVIDHDEDNILTFEPDTLWNTELGMKSTWFDGDLQINASLFYLRWNEIQTDQILPDGFSFIANAGKARNYGFEAEATARPFADLEISGAFFWNDPVLTEANSFLGAKAGDSLPNIPAISASFAATLEFHTIEGWDSRLTIDYSYVARSFLTFAEETAPRMGDYHSANARFAIQHNHLNLGVFANNLWNEHANTFAFGNPFSLADQPQATPIRPRTLGVFAEVEF